MLFKNLLSTETVQFTLADVESFSKGGNWDYLKSFLQANRDRVERLGAVKLPATFEDLVFLQDNVLSKKCYRHF